MHESASRPLGTLVTLDGDHAKLEREFEDRLRESSTLAVRVAYSVVRQRQDAEEVAQEAFAKAYSRFSQLRDRNSFRAWLVRMTWRLAIDRWRSDRRRTAREQSGVLEVRDPTAEGIVAANEDAQIIGVDNLADAADVGTGDRQAARHRLDN